MAIYPGGQTFLHNVLCKLLLWPAAKLSRAQRNTMGKNTLSKLSKLHLRNFGSDNIVRTSVCPLFHIRGCEMSHLLAGSARHILAVFNLVLDINFMAIWQLSKKVSLTGVTWLYGGVRYATHRVDVFVKVICWQDITFQLIAGSGPFFQGGIQFAFCLRKKLNYLIKTFVKKALESVAFGRG